MAKTSFLGFAGLSLTADTYGSSSDPHVILLHGGGQTKDYWSDLPLALAKAGRFVINIDLRGHGDSDRPEDNRYEFDAYVEDLRSVMTQLPSRPFVIASSFGGWVAAAAIGESDAHLASGLALLDTPPDLDEREIESIRESLATTGQSTAFRDWDPNVLSVDATQSVLSRFLDSAKKIRVPTLYVRGETSEITRMRSAVTFVESLIDGEFVEIKGAGHYMATDQFDLLNAALIDFLERKMPRAVPEYVAGSDARTLRDAMGCFATGVTVVTATASDGSPVGLTANSFTSVSLEPPLLLVCIARNASSLEVFESAANFGINILHIGQQPTSNVFASPLEDRFAEVEWELTEYGIPIILNSAASIECRKYAINDGGDHVILVGQVERARFDVNRDPLLYFGGRYRRLHLG